MSQENVEIARRAFKAFNERDAYVLHEVFTEEEALEAAGLSE